jgi:co-chaperonin GroES (HSP10)
VQKVEEPQAEGFKTVQVQDSFVYQGKIVLLPECPIHLGNRQLAIDDIILFAKYSPDTHEVDYDGQKMKLVKDADILAVL